MSHSQNLDYKIWHVHCHLSNKGVKVVGVSDKCGSADVTTGKMRFISLSADVICRYDGCRCLELASAFYRTSHPHYRPWPSLTTLGDGVRGKVLLTINSRPSPVDRTQRPARCRTQWSKGSYAASHAGPSASAETIYILNKDSTRNFLLSWYADISADDVHTFPCQNVESWDSTLLQQILTIRKLRQPWQLQRLFNVYF